MEFTLSFHHNLDIIYALAAKSDGLADKLASHSKSRNSFFLFCIPTILAKNCLTVLINSEEMKPNAAMDET